jgi:apolipoprotein N-acyltransferase
MWKKLSRHKRWAAIVAGLSMVLAFSPICLVPLVFGLPVLLMAVVRDCRDWKDGFKWGFLASFVIMLGGFYWVTYVIHTFGEMPWAIAGLLFLGFCGFGALNFPLFTALAAYLQRRFEPDRADGFRFEAWYVVALPALFTAVEFFVPKLFPWYVGHSFFFLPWMTQIAEITGASYLTFAVFSFGGALLLLLDKKRGPAVLGFPLLLFTVAIGFSLWRLSEPEPASKPLKVVLVQANIGSLQKAAARRGSVPIVEWVMNRYIDVTEQALKTATAKPDLIVWPETAMPFSLDSGGLWALRIREKVKQWAIPLLTGGYAESNARGVDYNAAFLLQPKEDGNLDSQLYRKNILLAFGEYFPGGEVFPALYRYFPEVSHFARGETQEPLLLGERRLGVTICYEAIVPEFYRRTIEPGVQAVVNLTNDSWFGPTSEPYQHGALSIFRAIEHRVPLIRVTNTGVSFTVDRLGRTSAKTPVYDEGFLVNDVLLPDAPPRTVYLRYGDWFIGLCLALLAVCVYALKRRPLAPVSA